MGTTTEKLTYLQGTKDAIKNAIVAKGVEVPEGTTFRSYAEKVGEIPAGGEGKTVEVEISTGMTGSISLVDKDGKKYVDMNKNGSKCNIIVDIENRYIEAQVAPSGFVYFDPSDMAQEISAGKYKILSGGSIYAGN